MQIVTEESIEEEDMYFVWKGDPDSFRLKGIRISL